MWNEMSYLDENEFVKKDAPSHVGHGDTCHDDEGADHLDMAKWLV